MTTTQWNDLYNKISYIDGGKNMYIQAICQNKARMSINQS